MEAGQGGFGGQDEQPDERSLRLSAEGGDPDGAFRLGCLLVDQERFEEAEPWLRRAVHTDHASDAAFYLAGVLESLGRSEEAEPWWVAAALAGRADAAYNLAGSLEERRRGDESAHWYHQVAKTQSPLADDAVHRLAERRIDDVARQLARREDWSALWDLVLSASIVDAVAAAKHLGEWRPPDGPGRALAEALVAEDAEAVTRAVAGRAAVASTRILPYALDAAGSAELIDGPLLAVAVSEYSEAAGFSYRIVTQDPADSQAEPYRGSRSHASIALLDAETVLAVRNASDTDAAGLTTFRWELVRYAPEGELVLASGTGTPMPRIVTTTHGYIVGLMMTSSVIVGGVEGPPAAVDLAPAGLRYRTNRLAADPTGTRVAFADDHIVVVADSQLQGQVAAVTDPASVHGSIEDLTFLSPDIIVTSGRTGMCRWAIDHGGMRAAVVAETPATVDELFAVPSWGIVGGLIYGGRVAWYDAHTLARVAPPHTLVGRRHPWYIRKASAAPGGRFVVYSGQLLVDDPRHETSFDSVTAIHDLHHLLSWVDRPLASLTDADHQQLTALLQGPVDQPNPTGHTLAADERRVLDLIRTAAEHQLT